MLPDYVIQWARDAWALRSWELRALPGYAFGELSPTRKALADLAGLLDGRCAGRALWWPWALRCVATCA